MVIFLILSEYFWILFWYFSDTFWILLDTFGIHYKHFWDTFRHFCVLLGAFWCFRVLLGTFGYSWVLLVRFSNFGTLELFEKLGQERTTNAGMAEICRKWLDMAQRAWNSWNWLEIEMELRTSLGLSKEYNRIFKLISKSLALIALDFFLYVFWLCTQSCRQFVEWSL